MICLAISTQCKELRKKIEPDYGLLDELLRLEALTCEQYDSIRITAVVYQRNDILLELMKKFDAKSTALIEALIKTDQQHVVNFIKKHQGN